MVADEGKTILATLKAGSYFGEISILNMGTAGGLSLKRRRQSVLHGVYSHCVRQSSNRVRPLRGLLRPVRAEQEGHVGRAQGLPGGQSQTGGHRSKATGKVQKSPFGKR